MDNTFSKIVVDKPEVETNSVDSGVRIDSKSKTEVPLSIYSKINKIPYSANFFKVDSGEVPMISGTLNRIENYVLSQIQERSLEDTTESYDNIMQEIFEAMGMEKTLRSDIRLDKIVKFLELLNRNKYGNISVKIRPNSNA